MHCNANTNDHTAAVAEAFFIANLIFVGIFYLALWVLYLRRYKNAAPLTQNHLKQTLFASSISTAIFLIINLIIILSSGYASVTALLSLEVYFMLLAPVFLLAGIIGFSKAVAGKDFRYPLLARQMNLNTSDEKTKL